MEQENAEKIVKQVSGSVAGRSSADTMRLWERYKTRASFWRYLTLLQVFLTFGLMASALIFFSNADTVVEVPTKPEPGTYSVNRLPDAEYISVAQSVVNLIETYQPYTVKKQFYTARQYLFDEALENFDEAYVGGSNPILDTVVNLGRTQQFRIDAGRVRVNRYSREGFPRVLVRIPGVRYKMFGFKHLPAETAEWHVEMTTIPRNAYNEYGIVVTDMRENSLNPVKKAPSKAAAG